MDFSILNTSQRGQWSKFENGLQELNRRFAKSRFDMWWLKQAVETYKKYGEALPPSFQYDQISQWQNIATMWMQGISQLNNAYALTQSGSAYVTPSQTVDNDIDLVVEKDSLPDDVVTNATFSTEFPDGNLSGGIIPLLIKSATVITAIVLISGMVTQVTESVVKHKRLDTNIERIKSKILSDMKTASPEIFKAWTDLEREQLKPAEAGFMSQLGKNLGGWLGVAAAAIAIMFVWKYMTGKK